MKQGRCDAASEEISHRTRYIAFIGNVGHCNWTH
jgi:hypothetical protein